MSRSFTHSQSARALVGFLIAALVVTSIPVAAQAPTVSSPLENFRANRNKPRVAGPPDRLMLPDRPSRGDVFAARVFEEPLVPVGGEPSDDDTAALGRALGTFYRRSTQGDTSALTSYLAGHPTSPWRASLLANLGSVHRRLGAFSDAMRVWDEAWGLTKDGSELSARAIADFSISHWLDVAASFGQVDAVQARLEQITGRNVRGSAGTRLAMAREMAFLIKTYPDQVIASGPEALRVILEEQRGASEDLPPALANFRPTAAGTSLAEIGQLASSLGLKLRPARWTGRGEIQLPAVMHWKLGHFSPILERRGDQYRVVDVALGGTFWVSGATLTRESSGYFLVPERVAEGQWRTITEAEAGAVIGHSCLAGGPASPPSPPPGCDKAGMCGYFLDPSSVSLQLVDTPLLYSTARGPKVALRLSYQQHEMLQPQVFSYANIGPMWSFNWQRFLQEEPAYCVTVCVPARVWVHDAGSREMYLDPDGDGAYDPSWQSRALVVRVSTSPLRYERRLRDGSVEVYGVADGGAAGQKRIFISAMIDRQGQSVEFTWDAQFRLIAVTDAIGQVTELEYEHPVDTRRITGVTDPFGRTASLHYAPDGMLASITDIIGMTSSFTYGSSDFLASLTTAYGTTTFRREADPQDSWWARMVEATDPLGDTEHLHMEWQTTALTATVPANEVPTGFEGKNHTLDHYNTFHWSKRAWKTAPGDKSKAVITHWLLMNETPAGQLRLAVPHSVKKPLESRTWYMYPGQGTTSNVVGWFKQPSSIGRRLDDGSSQIWDYTYDSFGNVLSATDPLGRRTSYVYASNGIDLLEVRQTTGAENQLLASFSNYTAQRRPQTHVDAAGRTTAFTYNSAGQPLTITNAKSEVTTLAYDTDGHLLSVDGPGVDDTTIFTYDGYGRLRTQTTPDGYATTNDYDAFDRVTRVTYPDGTHDAYTYDRLDLATARDRQGRLTRFFYDARRNLVGTRDALGRSVQQEWGPDGTLDKVIDAQRQATTWERDVQNRVTRQVRADSSSTTYAYESLGGRLRTITDAKSQVTTFAYGLDDAMASIVYSNATVPTPATTFTYDAIYPRAATMVDGTGTTTYTYRAVGVNGAGKIATIDGPLANDTLTYTYDELNRVTNRTLNTSGVAWAYDALSRVTSETTPIGTFAYTYDAASTRLNSVTYPNNQSTTYTYFGNTGDRRLQTLHNKLPGGATLSKFDYTYDVTGNIRSWQQQADADAPVLWSYGYDAVDQLLTAVKSTTGSTSTVLARYAYAYDAAGNRISEQIGDTVSGVTVTALNRLMSQQPAGQLRVAGLLSEAGTVTLNGRPASVDAANGFSGTIPIVAGANVLTIGATDGSGNAGTRVYDLTSTGAGRTFTYDANGNLVSDGTRTFEWDARNQLVSVTEGPRRSEFRYDGQQRRTRRIEKESGVTIADITVIWCDEQICEERSTSGGTTERLLFHHGEQASGAARFFTADHLQSVVDVTNSSSTLLSRYEYDPFGRQSVVEGTNVTTVGFTGHERQTTGQLWLTKYRAYDSAIGRWLSEDPEGFADGPNLYGYVSNRPIGAIDPFGLQGQLIQGGAPPPGGAPPGCDASAWLWVSRKVVSQNTIRRWKFVRAYELEVPGLDDTMTLPVCFCEYKQAGVVEVTKWDHLWKREVKCCSRTYTEFAHTATEQRAVRPGIGDARKVERSFMTQSGCSCP